MRKLIILFILFAIASNVNAQHPRVYSESQHPLRHRGSRVITSTGDFDNILSSSDDDVQSALDTLDDAITSSTPSVATSSCTPSQIAYASGFLYVCVAANTWQRVAIATWAITDKLLLDDGSSHLLLDDGTSKLLIRQ